MVFWYFFNIIQVISPLNSISTGSSVHHSNSRSLFCFSTRHSVGRWRTTTTMWIVNGELELMRLDIELVLRCYAFIPPIQFDLNYFVDISALYAIYLLTHCALFINKRISEFNWHLLTKLDKIIWPGQFKFKENRIKERNDRVSFSLCVWSVRARITIVSSLKKTWNQLLIVLCMRRRTKYAVGALLTRCSFE